MQIELTNEIRKLIDEWLVDRDNDRRSFGSSGTVALRIAERISLRLSNRRKADFDLGAQKALDLLGTEPDLSETAFQKRLDDLSREILK